jgi:putative redox protein
MANPTATLIQISPTTSEAHMRTHSLLIDRPEAKGGTDRGAMGGEVLLAALGGCFLSNLLEIIRTRDAAIREVRVVVSGTLESAPARYSAIRLHISAQHEDAEQLEKFVTMAERACIVANSLRESVALSFVIGEATA